MKKIAIIAALTLAIGASMTAGTMARYTQDLGTKDATVTTKKFNVGIDQFEKINFVVEPGEVASQTIKLNTKNVETNMTLAFEVRGFDATETQLINDLLDAGAKFTITNNVNTEVMDFKKFEDGGAYQHLNVSAGVENVEYTVKLDWEDGKDTTKIKDNDELTQKVQGKKLDFNVRVVAMQ